ncbi:MAG: MATE family efflux transporter [Clostridia bacterium]|nr:MATE family efflux transporter [Clostridia bacterium]
MTKDRGFYSNFFSLWKILVLNNIIILGVNLADNIMLGRFDEFALGGATACNQVQFVFQQVILGLSNAVVVLGSQYWGEKRTGPIKKLSSAAVALGIIFSAILFVFASVMPEKVVGLFTDSQKIIEEGVTYLSIIKYTYPVFALTNIILAILRSVESIKVGFYVSVTTLVLNISLNYVLIFGKLGFSPMGAKGAAIATLIARIGELIFVIIYVLFIEKKIKWSVSDLRHQDKSLVKKYCKTCIPFVITDGLFGVSTALQTVILGHMTEAALTANSVSTTLYQVLKVAAVGSASAAAVIIGKTIGEGKTIEKIKEYTKTLQIIFLLMGIATSIILFIVRIPIVSMYNISDEAKSLANGFLLVLCVTCIGTAYQMPTNTGIIRGGGDSKFILIVDIISIWGIVLPLSFVAAFVWKWHPIAIIACLNADQIFKSVPAFIKANRYKWIRRLTK